MSDKQQEEALETFKEIFGSSASKVTASEVMQGLTKTYDLDMISSLPRPELVVNAKFVSGALRGMGFPEEADLIEDIVRDYQKAHVSKAGKGNRAYKIIEAFASLFRAELEIEKSKKGMFSK